MSRFSLYGWGRGNQIPMVTIIHLTFPAGMVVESTTTLLQCNDHTYDDNWHREAIKQYIVMSYRMEKSFQTKQKKLFGVMMQSYSN
jgi:hypothetical protein